MRPCRMPLSAPVPVGTAAAAPTVPAVATLIARAATMAVFLPLQRGGRIAGEVMATLGSSPVGT